MKTDDLIAHAEELRELWKGKSQEQRYTVVLEARQFIGQYVGKDSQFYQDINEAYGYGRTPDILEALIRYARSGMLTGTSLRRQAQAEVVSDVLEQAGALLENHFHPAAAAVLAGAALEEFLRSWVEEENLPLEGTKRSIDVYATALRKADKIDKTYKKEIDAWAGLRNDAAHGDWEKVDNRQRIQVMVDGIGLFIRRQGIGRKT